MYRGIIQSALAKRMSLELDYREPSTTDGLIPEEDLTSQLISDEFTRMLLTLCSAPENLQ
jgi:hypothetical protein